MITINTCSCLLLFQMSNPNNFILLGNPLKIRAQRNYFKKRFFFQLWLKRKMLNYKSYSVNIIHCTWFTAISKIKTRLCYKMWRSLSKVIYGNIIEYHLKRARAKYSVKVVHWTRESNNGRLALVTKESYHHYQSCIL